MSYGGDNTPLLTKETNDAFSNHQIANPYDENTQNTNTVNDLNHTQLPPYITESSDKSEILVKPDPKRWYLLALFSALGFTQGMVWNTWGPISASCELAFGWTDGTVALMSNWGPIAYILVTLLFAWLMDVKGLRAACLLAALCVAIGTGLRCITSKTPLVTWLIHSGQFLNGLGGPVAMGGPPVMSAVWFPVHQRTTATAISAGVNGLGVAIAYVIGPQMVPDVANATVCLNKSVHHTQDYNISNCDEQKHDITKTIMLLMYIECALSVLILLLMLIYFPSKPKNAPSITASIQRTDFVKGMKSLATNSKFWMLAIPYSLSGGVFGGWQSVLDVILKPHHISEDTAGWIGFYGTIAGQLSGLVVGIFADIFGKKMRLFMLILYSGATVVFTILALECTGIIPINTASLYGLNILGNICLGGTCPLFFELGCEASYPVGEGMTNGLMTWLNNVAGLIFLLVLMIPNIASLYALNILGNICIYGTIPLFFELGCEASYPVAEGITNGLMTWLNNVAGLIFLLVLMIPNIGTIWMNWVLAACIALCLPVFMFYKERYSRYDIDAIETVVNAEKVDPVNASDQNS